MQKLINCCDLILSEQNNFRFSVLSRAGLFGFEPASGLIEKISGLAQAWYVLCGSGSYKNIIEITLHRWIKILFIPISHVRSNQPILHGGRGKMARLFNSWIKCYWNIRFGMRVGVYENFLEKLILMWWRHQSDVTTSGGSRKFWWGGF